MVVLCRDEILQIGNIPNNIKEKISPDLVEPNISYKTLNLESNEKKLIIQALDKTGGNRTAASEKLGISRRTLHRKLNEYSIKQERYNSGK
jgi:DNA-binding NtrC family response regulator